MDRLRASVASSAPRTTTSSRRSTLHIKKRVDSTRKEERLRLAQQGKGSRDREKGKAWADRSMLFHVATFITVLFGIFSVSYVLLLWKSADFFEARLVAEVDRSYQIEAQFYMASVLGQTIAACQNQFTIQEELMTKHAVVLTELLGKRRSTPQNPEPAPHPFYWESTIPRPMDSAAARAQFLALFNNITDPSAFSGLFNYFWAYHTIGGKAPTAE